MTRALLIGQEPGMELGFQYVEDLPYEAVVIGSLSLAQLLRFREEPVLTALAEGTEKLGHSVYRWGKKTAHHRGGSPDPPGFRAAARARRGDDTPGQGNYGGNKMRVGKVIGSIWATRKAACLQGQTFLVVKSEDEVIVAADQVGAGEGDRVLLATGTVASRYCMDAPVDAAIVAIVDEK